MPRSWLRRSTRRRCQGRGGCSTSVPGSSTIGGASYEWAQNIIWGTSVLSGRFIFYRSLALDDNIIWGTALSHGYQIVGSRRLRVGTMATDNIIWGTDFSVKRFNIVFGADTGDNIIWGTDTDNIIWGTNLAPFRVLGKRTDSTIRWAKNDASGNISSSGSTRTTSFGAPTTATTSFGARGPTKTTSFGVRRATTTSFGAPTPTTSSGARQMPMTTSFGARPALKGVFAHGLNDDDNIIWGTVDDNIIWGTSDDNIIWGTDGDNIIWGTDDVSNIIWGTSTGRQQ